MSYVPLLIVLVGLLASCSSGGKAVDASDWDKAARNFLLESQRLVGEERIARLELADRCIGKALELDSENCQYLIVEGEVLRDLEQYDKARDAFNRSIEIDPMEVGGWIGLGSTLQREGMCDRALDCFIKARLIDKEEALGQYQSLSFDMARCHYGLGQHQEAVWLFKESLEEEYITYQVYYEMGLSYLLLGDRRNASDAFDNSTHINESHANSWFGLGVSNLFLMGDREEYPGEYDLARRSFGEAARLWNESGDIEDASLALFTLGMANDMAAEKARYRDQADNYRRWADENYSQALEMRLGGRSPIGIFRELLGRTLGSLRPSGWR